MPEIARGIITFMITLQFVEVKHKFHTCMYDNKVFHTLNKRLNHVGGKLTCSLNTLGDCKSTVKRSSVYAFFERQREREWIN